MGSNGKKGEGDKPGQVADWCCFEGKSGALEADLQSSGRGRSEKIVGQQREQNLIIDLSQCLINCNNQHFSIWLAKIWNNYNKCWERIKLKILKIR